MIINFAQKTLRRISVLCLLAFVASCYRVPDKIEPQIQYAVQDRYVQALPTPFSPLSEAQQDQNWPGEYKIGLAFAKELDLYRAITAFKRALILLGNKNPERRQEMEYNIILSYYLGRRYQEALEFFQQSGLRTVPENFPAFHDLLLILYESYLQTDENKQAANILQLLRKFYPATAQRLAIASGLLEGNLKKLEKIAFQPPPKPYLEEFIELYQGKKKSIDRAGALNAFLPGAGYWYVGQKQSAITAFLLNGLFIWASYEFFHRGYTAAGIITTGFEVGWYFGGIYGAKESARYYNERLFETNAAIVMSEQKLFPVLMLKYAF
jgi:tetratricopeptide (TPR) repeat protein